MAIYRFRIGTDQRIIRAASLGKAKIVARKLWGPQIKSAIVAWFHDYAAPTLTGASAYDAAVKIIDKASSARDLRAAQRGGVDYLRAMYNPHDPAQVKARAESKGRKALAILATMQQAN